MKNRKIRILILGDGKVGKTSWITSLVFDNQPDQIPSFIDPVVFTEMFLETYQVSTVLIDTPSDILNQPDKFKDEVKSAQVILLLYDLSSRSTIDSLSAKWMESIEKENPNVPVIIIGNKRDLLDEIQNQDKIPESNRIEKVMVPLIKKFKQVQMGFECSALVSQLSIQDIIQGAHRAVLFPLSPLYDISQRTITPLFEKALARIFRICDKDNDNKWSDEELREFEFGVFSGELSSNDIQGIKRLIKEDEIISQASEKGTSSQNEITFEGFKILMKKCVELMKMQICWAIVRHFNYDDKLELDKKLFKDSLLVNPKQGQTIELSGKGFQFLINQCFKRFCKDRKDSFNDVESVLYYQDITEIFFPYPHKEENPFHNLFPIVTSKKDYLLQEEWLNLWAYMTRQDYQDVYKKLVYIGYQGSLEETFLITNATNCLSQLSKMSQRYVINVCLVSPDNGCSLELNKMLQKYKKAEKFNEQGGITMATDFVTQVRFDNGKKKAIIFTFATSFEFKELLSSNEDKENPSPVRKFDQIGILYKNEKSLEDFLVDHKEHLMQYPKFFIDLGDKNKANFKLNEHLRDYSREYCQLNINDFEASLHKSIFNLLEKPTKGLHQDYIQKIQNNDNFFRKNKNQILIGGGVLGFLGIILWVKRPLLRQLFTQIKKNIGL